jgi:hypothetical protein
MNIYYLANKNNETEMGLQWVDFEIIISLILLLKIQFTITLPMVGVFTDQ